MSFYLKVAGERWRATGSTVGPWDPALQHGSPPAALLARALEQRLTADQRLGQLAYDFLGPVPVGEATVRTEVVRPGKRVELLRAALEVDGRVAMQLSGWRLTIGAGRTQATPESRPLPALPGPQAQAFYASVPPFGYGEALEWRFAEGHFDGRGPAAAWTRPRMPLVEGEQTSPLCRLLLMVDSANGISAVLDPATWLFVPVALTVTVWRAPRTEWVGMRAATELSSDGVGVCEAELFDEQGHLGRALQTLFVAPR